MYTVEFKNVDSVKPKWDSIKNIIADGFLDENLKSVRFFLLNDNTRYEIPTSNIIFRFSKERQELIEENAKEAKNES